MRQPLFFTGSVEFMTAAMSTVATDLGNHGISVPPNFKSTVRGTDMTVATSNFLAETMLNLVLNNSNEPYTMDTEDPTGGTINRELHHPDGRYVVIRTQQHVLMGLSRHLGSLQPVRAHMDQVDTANSFMCFDSAYTEYVTKILGNYPHSLSYTDDPATVSATP